MPTSPLGANNARIRDAAKLRQKKFRGQTGCILIEGARLVADALAAGAAVNELFCTSAFRRSDHGKVLCVCSQCPSTLISPQAAAKLSETRTPQGVFAVVEFTTASFDAAFSAPATGPSVRTDGHFAAPLVLLADSIADPGNLGAMIRSAAALGANGVVASGDSCDALNPKCVRATMGAIFRLPVAADVALPAAIDTLKAGGIRIIAAVARRGKAPWELDLRGATALLIGSEAAGLPSAAVKLADARVTVPMPGGTESLNAAATAAALLYEAARQRAGVT